MNKNVNNYRYQPQNRLQNMLKYIEKTKLILELIFDIPTHNEEIIERLREFDHPICIILFIIRALFGETDVDRYERLKTIILKLQEQNRKAHTNTKYASKAETHSSELWYHEGSQDLLDVRLWIAYYSLCRVQERLQTERQASKKPEFEKAAKFQDVQKRFNAFEYKSSQLGDDRPLTYCQISPDKKSVVTASRSGLCKQWDLETLEMIRDFKGIVVSEIVGHGEHAGAIVFHPSLFESDSNSVVQLASCCSTGLIFLWNLKKLLQEEPIGQLPKHHHRISRIAFHPSGRFLGSTW
ncbi:hypothetical protein HZS_721 [Henneguya salminicola]|nr:hypothetical protein HZS_721 [Henneguya salminicola]